MCRAEAWHKPVAVGCTTFLLEDVSNRDRTRECRSLYSTPALTPPSISQADHHSTYCCLLSGGRGGSHREVVPRTVTDRPRLTKPWCERASAGGRVPVGHPGVSSQVLLRALRPILPIPRRLLPSRKNAAVLLPRQKFAGGINRMHDVITTSLGYTTGCSNNTSLYEDTSSCNPRGPV